MERRQSTVFSACLAAIGAAAVCLVAAAADEAIATQELLSVEASDQVMSARWMRRKDSYVLLVALDRSKSSTRKPSGIPKSATLSAEQALRLAELEQRMRSETAQYNKQKAAKPAPAPPGADRSSFFIGNTIANLRGMDPWFACDRTLTLVDGRRTDGTSPEPRIPRAPSTLDQPYPPVLKESRVEAWLLKSDGTQILPVTYSCDPGVSNPARPAVEIAYIFAVPDSAQAVAAAVRIDGDYYIEKLQPLVTQPAAK
jgi:hypothetical protein